jgi:hypothetical protein
MERYTDTDIINDAIDFIRTLPDFMRPLLTIWETPPKGYVHEGMRYFNSFTIIRNDKMIRTLQIVNLGGAHLAVEVKDIKELHVSWNYSKYKLPQNLRHPLLFYRTQAFAAMKKESKLTPPPELTPPPVRKISIGGKND